MALSGEGRLLIWIWRCGEASYDMLRGGDWRTQLSILVGKKVFLVCVCVCVCVCVGSIGGGRNVLFTGEHNDRNQQMLQPILKRNLLLPEAYS